VTAEQWARLKTWFGEALAANPETRREIMERVRAESPELASELASLLAAHDDPTHATFELAPRPAAWRERYPKGVPAGTEIGAYRVVRELGRGGAGLVLLAERADDEFHRPVALKLLRFLRPGSDAHAGLRLERGSLARMQHGNVATLLDWGTTADGVAWLATEFIEGQPIDQYCRAHRLNEAAVLELFAQIASAVEYAHSRQVLHRDIKPGNILVSQDGVVKLLDFGIAQIGDEQPGARQFTPGYASPEQLRGEAVSPASDVYSLAVVLGQILTGQLPPETARLSRPLAAILEHALAADPARRYASVGAMMKDLARYRGHLPPLEVPTSWLRRANLFLRRNRRLLALSASGAILATLVVVLRRPPLAASQPPPRPSPAVVFAQQEPLLSPGALLPLRVVWPDAVHVQSVEVVTQGVPNLDFSSHDTANCTGDFATGSSCIMHIEFVPTAGGWRLGAALFRNAAHQVLHTEFISGRGNLVANWVPVPAGPPRLITGFDQARGLSTDGAGNVYLEEARGNTVDEIPAGSSRRLIVARLLLQSGATAVDGAGTLFFSSSANHAIYAMNAGAPQAIATFPSTMLLDNNLSVDGAGNLFTSALDGSIYMVTATSHRIVQLYPGARGHRFVGMAVDIDGNLFCADYLLNSIFELAAGTTELVRRVPPDGHLYQPHAIALLYTGDLLVGNDRLNSPILRYGENDMSATVLPIAGGMSLAVYDQSRLFAVTNNETVAVYNFKTQPIR